jgi:hypothetical protein
LTQVRLRRLGLMLFQRLTAIAIVHFINSNNDLNSHGRFSDIYWSAQD